MATKLNRVLISVPADIETEIERLKQTSFSDRPYAEIYRQAIRLGLERMKDSAQEKDGTSAHH